MWSVPSRFSEPSTAVRMFAGLLSRLPGAPTVVGDEAELRRQHDLVAAVLDRAADEFLVGEGAVDLGGVDEGDAQVERPVDGADRLGVVGSRARVGGGHPHGAQADPGHIQISELDVLHGCAVDQAVVVPLGSSSLHSSRQGLDLSALPRMSAEDVGRDMADCARRGRDRSWCRGLPPTRNLFAADLAAFGAEPATRHSLSVDRSELS